MSASRTGAQAFGVDVALATMRLHVIGSWGAAGVGRVRDRLVGCGKARRGLGARVALEVAAGELSEVLGGLGA